MGVVYQVVSSVLSIRLGAEVVCTPPQPAMRRLASEILGHSSLDMTKRYAHLHDEHKKESISKVEQALMLKPEIKELEVKHD